MRKWSQTKVDYPIALYLYLQLHAYIESYMKMGRKVQELKSFRSQNIERDREKETKRYRYKNTEDNYEEQN
jgi:hypothetical protein